MKSILTIALIFALSPFAQAGRVKDLYIDHQDAVLEHLGDQMVETWTFVDTKFVKASPGNDIAISSTLKTYVHELNRSMTIECVTEFYQVNPRRYDLAYVGCH